MGIVGLNYRGPEPPEAELRRRAAILRAQAERLERLAARLEAEWDDDGPVLPPLPEQAEKEA